MQHFVFCIVNCIKTKICENFALRNNSVSHQNCKIMKTMDYGHEGQNIEFKSSFVYPAKSNSKLAHDHDQAFVVFKAACAMMNAEGGKIYIGIDNDTRQPIRDKSYGISADKKILSKKDNDQYALYINNKIQKYFVEDKYVRGIMRAEETDDPDVVVIVVKAADRVIFMQNKAGEKFAFRREGGSSRIMDNSMIKQRKNELLKMRPEKKDLAAQIIQEAIENKKKIKIYNYKSSHSGKTDDRIVEPCALICDGRSVWCYEAANEGDDPMRQFKLSRMASVECLNEPWEHEDLHREAYVDAFEWSRDVEPTIHITVQLEPKAYNFLCEIVPVSKEFITDCGDSTWLLDCDVHSLEPVVDFCRACKDNIVVYGCDELKAILDPKSVEIAPEVAPEEEPAVKAPEGTLREEYVSLFGKTRSYIRKCIENQVSKTKEYFEPLKECRIDIQSLGGEVDPEAADCKLYDVGKLFGVLLGMISKSVGKWVEVQVEQINNVA